MSDQPIKARPQTHSWAVSFKIFSEDRYHTTINMYEGVIAETMEAAIAKVRDFYPHAEFTSINHRGVIHHL